MGGRGREVEWEGGVGEGGEGIGGCGVCRKKDLISQPEDRKLWTGLDVLWRIGEIIFLLIWIVRCASSLLLLLLCSIGHNKKRSKTKESRV